MKIHEYQGKAVLAPFGVPVPKGQVAYTADEAVEAAKALGFPVVVVARTALGTINHTLLTLEALRRRVLRVAGVVMVGDRNPENRGAIERYGGVPVLGEMPRFNPLDAARVGAWAATDLDPDRHLLEWLR